MHKYDQQIFEFTQESNSNFPKNFVDNFRNLISLKLEEHFTILPEGQKKTSAEGLSPPQEL